MIIITHHRSRKLADRNRRQLEKKYFIVRLDARRNDKGRYSTGGHTFVWEVFDKPKGKRIEIVLHFDYGSTKKKNLIQFQVHIFGPSESTDSEAIAAVRKFERDEKPKGWKWKEIFWAHPPKSAQGPIDDDPENEDEIAQSLAGVRRAAIGAPDLVSVERKSAREDSVRQSRRPNRKAKQSEGDA